MTDSPDVRSIAERPKQYVVMIIDWVAGETLHTRAYGPWEVQPDGSHNDQVAAFARRWQAEHGTWLRACLHIPDMDLEAR